MKTIRLLLALTVPTMTVLSCSKNGSGGKGNSECDPTPIVLTSNEQAVIAAQNQFAFDYLHQALLHDPTPTNKMISPLSIYLALGMVYNGADHATKDAMQEALRLKGLSIDDLNKTCLALYEQLPDADCKVKMEIANSIWYRTGYSPLPAFLSTTTNYFGAEVQPFTSPDPAKAINDWVSAKTHDKIKKLVDVVSPSEIFWLINAIYFKGSWRNEFDKKKTTKGTFTKANGATVSTPFMYLENDSINVFQNDSVQIAELPYGGGNFAMYVILPKTSITAAGLAGSIPASTFRNWQLSTHGKKVKISLPSFRSAYAIDDMKADLAGLGMGIAFTGQADFSKLYGQSTQISRAIHKTFIDVTEEGTEAAAVTGIGIELTSMPSVFTLTADRPFLYVIAEKTSGVVLFTGIVHDPSDRSE